MVLQKEIIDSIPKLNITKKEVRDRIFTKKGWEENIAVFAIASLSYLLYTKSGIRPAVENFFLSIPILNTLLEIDFIKVGIITMALFIIKDVFD